MLENGFYNGIIRIVTAPRTFRISIAVAIGAILLTTKCHAQLAIPNLGAVNETFDTLGGNLTLPSHWRISNGPYPMGNPTWNTANASVRLSAQSGFPTPRAC